MLKLPSALSPFCRFGVAQDTGDDIDHTKCQRPSVTVDETGRASACRVMVTQQGFLWHHSQSVRQMHHSQLLNCAYGLLISVLGGEGVDGWGRGGGVLVYLNGTRSNSTRRLLGQCPGTVRCVWMKTTTATTTVKQVLSSSSRGISRVHYRVL